jgi:hypothetical protein
MIGNPALVLCTAAKYSSRHRYLGVGGSVVPLPAAPAVRALLGCEPHEATADHVRRLLAAEVRENDWLNYKRALPRDVAKSVAVLANAAGGVLIIGIHEEEGSRRPLLVGCPDPARPAWRPSLSAALASDAESVQPRLHLPH